jgi:hypothetical protein
LIPWIERKTKCCLHLSTGEGQTSHSYSHCFSQQHLHHSGLLKLSLSLIAL